MNFNKIFLTVFFVIFAISFVLYYLPKVKEVFYIFSGKFRMSSKTKLTADEQRKVLISAIYTNQQSGILNTLLPKIEITRRMKVLNEYWGIANSNEAHEALERLRDRGHRYFFPAVIALSKADSESDVEAVLNGAFTDKEEQGQALEMYSNMKETVDLLQENKMITSLQDLERIGVDGWDAGRLVFMARLCLEARLITEEEAWEYIDAGDKIAHESLTSWDDMARSYVIGRCLWAGKDMMASGMASIAERFITKEDSPFKQHAY